MALVASTVSTLLILRAHHRETEARKTAERNENEAERQRAEAILRASTCAKSRQIFRERPRITREIPGTRFETGGSTYV